MSTPPPPAAPSRIDARALLDPADTPEVQREKLLRITEALMRRAEAAGAPPGAGASSYSQFESAAQLEGKVYQRTLELEAALSLLNRSNSQLAAANAQTEAARRNLSDAIEAVPEGFALFDPDDRLVLCNARFCQPFPDVYPSLRPGLRYDDLIVLIAGSIALVLPEGTKAADWAAERMACHGRRGDSVTVALTGARWLQVSEYTTKTGGKVLLQNDVSAILRAEHEAAERLLDDQARVVRTTLAHISQGVAIFNAELRLIGGNDRAADLLAIDRRRFRPGLVFADFLDFLGESGAALRDWSEGSPTLGPLRHEMLLESGAVLDLDAQQMSDGGLVISVTDVTAERNAFLALRRANETLEARVAARTRELNEALVRTERANAARSRFVAAASHDLLQPLSAAKLFLSSMADEPLPPRVQGALGKTQSALHSVETILAALLDISRLESGRLEVRPQPLALGPLLSRLADEVTLMAERKGLELRLHLRDFVVLSDPLWLRRVLQNLIGNALRYTETGGVLIAVRTGRTGVRVEITDTGPGIPESEHQAIFREFHRAGGARVSASEGMGLGLAIVERASAHLGHRITLRSRLGHGSRFVVSLGPPLVTTAAQPAGSGEAALARADLPPDTIGLLIAPDPEMRRALIHLFEGWGVSLFDVPDLVEAQALLDEIGLPPDFLLVDALPGAETEGLAVIEALNRRLGPLPARLLSGSRSRALVQGATTLGAGVLVKPLQIDPLLDFVTEAARLRA